MEELDEELSEDIDAGENITKVPFHDVLLVFVLEAGGFSPHFVEVFAFHVLVISVFLHVDLVVLLDEDCLNSQEND